MSKPCPAEVQQCAAARLRLVGHPRRVPFDVTPHGRTDPAIDDVRDAAELAGCDHALDGHCPERVADHERDAHPRALVGCKAGESRHGVGVGTPRLFHDEWEAGGDQKAKSLGHVAVPAEGNDEFRSRRLDHPAVVGEGRAAKALGTVSGDPFGAVGDPDDVASEIPQDAEISRIVSRVPMAHVDRGDAFRDAHGGPPLESIRRGARRERRGVSDYSAAALAGSMNRDTHLLRRFRPSRYIASNSARREGVGRMALEGAPPSKPSVARTSRYGRAS